MVSSVLLVARLSSSTKHPEPTEFPLTGAFSPGCTRQEVTSAGVMSQFKWNSSLKTGLWGGGSHGSSPTTQEGVSEVTVERERECTYRGRREKQRETYAWIIREELQGEGYASHVL